jgi:lambda family phage minor tail protein L
MAEVKGRSPTYAEVPYGVGDDYTPPPLRADVQKSAPGDIIILFDIDTTVIGGTDIWYLCSGLVDGAPPRWRGNAYMPFPVEASGFEWSGRGALPRPKITVANSGATLLSAVINYNDLLGAKVTRWKTLRKYLDDSPTADPDSYFVPDVYYIDRKSNQTKTQIDFELAASIDQQGVQLPARQFIRDSCSWTYRRWDAATNTFIYGTCPYAGGNYFDVNDVTVVDPSSDVCSKRLTGCKVRFGANNELPFAGFPSISRVR